jgi:glycosyltransferase involved in cell wall biosynthesis
VVGDGVEKQNLLSLTNELQLNEAIRFVGHTSFGKQLFDFYRQSDLLIIPSFSEGYPKVIGEARAFGLPIIATNVGGMSAKDSTQHGIFRVESNKPEVLAEAINTLFTNSELYQKLSKEAISNLETQTIEYWNNKVFEIITKNEVS